MGGEGRLVLLDRLEDKEYAIGMPTMYARGILFGKMVLELADHSKIENKQNEMQCDVEFKTKVCRRPLVGEKCVCADAVIPLGLLLWLIQLDWWQADAQGQDSRRALWEVV
jgi:Oxysterol-binding protein